MRKRGSMLWNVFAHYAPRNLRRWNFATTSSRADVLRVRQRARGYMQIRICISRPEIALETCVRVGQALRPCTIAYRFLHGSRRESKLRHRSSAASSERNGGLYIFPPLCRIYNVLNENCSWKFSVPRLRCSLHERTWSSVSPNVSAHVYMRTCIRERDFSFNFNFNPSRDFISFTFREEENCQLAYIVSEKGMEIIRAQGLDGPRERELANKGCNGTDVRRADRVWASWISSWAAAISISYRSHDASDRCFFLFTFPFYSPCFAGSSLCLPLPFSLLYFPSHHAH